MRRLSSNGASPAMRLGPYFRRTILVDGSGAKAPLQASNPRPLNNLGFAGVRAFSSAKKRDYYEVLGCSKTAPAAELKKAYFQLAKKYHPDQNKGNKEAEVRFQEAAEAYEVLSDDKKREAYDRFGHAGVDPSAGAGGAGSGPRFDQRQAEEIFRQFFGGGAGGFGNGGGFGGFGGFDAGQAAQPKGEDVVINVNLKLKDVLSPVEKTVVYGAHSTCETCSGSGSSTKTPESTTCKHCKGTGMLLKTVGGFMRVQSVCNYCNGKGSTLKSPCKSCSGSGRTYKSDMRTKVTLPSGIDDNMIYRVVGKGSAGMNGAPAGDLIVEVEIEQDPKFERDGADIKTTCEIDFVKAVLGGTEEIPSLDGTRLELKVNHGTQHGDVVRVRGKGVPKASTRQATGVARGDLFVEYKVKIPKKISENQKKLLLEFERDGKPGPSSGKASSSDGPDGGSGSGGDDGSDGGKGLFGKLKETMGI